MSFVPTGNARPADAYYDIDGPRALRINDAPVTYFIKTSSIMGQPIKTNLKGFKFTLKGPASAEPTVEEVEVGKYAIKYTPPQPGTYKLTVFIFDRKMFVNESCEVLPEFDEPKIMEFKLHNMPEALKMGKLCSFDLKITNKTSGDPFEHVSNSLAKPNVSILRVDKKDLVFTVRGPGNRPCKVVGPDKGSVFKGEFRVFKPSQYIVTLAHQGQDVLRKPGVVEYESKADTSSKVQCPNATIQAGSQLAFNILAYANNNALERGGDPFEVEAAGPAGSLDGKEVKVIDKDDGSYAVSITLDKPGKYKFFCELQGSAVQGSPLAITVE